MRVKYRIPLSLKHTLSLYIIRRSRLCYLNSNTHTSNPVRLTSQFGKSILKLPNSISEEVVIFSIFTSDGSCQSLNGISNRKIRLASSTFAIARAVEPSNARQGIETSKQPLFLNSFPPSFLQAYTDRHNSFHSS